MYTSINAVRVAFDGTTEDIGEGIEDLFEDQRSGSMREEQSFVEQKANLTSTLTSRVYSRAEFFHQQFASGMSHHQAEILMESYFRKSFRAQRERPQPE